MEGKVELEVDLSEYVIDLINQIMLKENKTFDEVIEASILKTERINVFNLLCSNKSNLTFKEVQEILDEDYY